jgi:hypothetical protein
MVGSQEIAWHNAFARRLECQHRPWWRVWYGQHTRRYWALALWIRSAGAMLDAETPERLDAAMATFEMLHPKSR